MSCCASKLAKFHVSPAFRPNFSQIRSWAGHAALALVLAAAVFVTGFANLVAFEEQHLGTAFSRVNLGWQRCGVAELKGDITFPFGFERCHVDDDAAARIGALAQGRWSARCVECGSTQPCEPAQKLLGNDADVALEIDEALFVEVLRVHDGGVDVGEDLELVGAANVVAVAAGAVADDFLAVCRCPDLPRFEGFDHALLLGHAANPAIRFDAHAISRGTVGIVPDHGAISDLGNNTCVEPSQLVGRCRTKSEHGELARFSQLNLSDYNKPADTRLVSFAEVLHVRFQTFSEGWAPAYLLASFPHFDFTFAIWVLNGAMAPFISETFNLSPAQKGFMISVPILAGAMRFLWA